MMRFALAATLAAASLPLAACAHAPAQTTREGEMATIARQVTQLEKKSGGRLGVAVTDADGTLLFGHRQDERFAMCSTFKLLLAGHVLYDATHGGLSLRTPLPVTRADIVSHSPDTEKSLPLGEVRLGFAAQSAVMVSDNAAANLILKATGGPQGFTQRMRAMGDEVTRLDRWETELNENALGDPRDTTSPAAMAKSAATFVFGDRLHESHRKSLRGWMVESQTGLKRIRAGLPSDWVVGDKTGTCSNAYNDVAFVEQPDGQRFMIAVYLDRPKATGDTANAIIADVTRAIAGDLSD